LSAIGATWRCSMQPEFTGPPVKPAKLDKAAMYRDRDLAHAFRLTPVALVHIRAAFPDCAAWIDACREQARRDERALWEIEFRKRQKFYISGRPSRDESAENGPGV